MDKMKEKLIEDNIDYARWLAHRWAETQKVLDYDDLESLALLGLTTAAKSYNPDKGTSFNTYARIIIENNFRNAYKKERRRLNYTQPLLEDKDSDSYNIENDSIFRTIFESTLNEEEKEVLLLAYEYGYSQREIGQIKNVSQTKINSIIKNAKEKLKIALEAE